MAILEVRNGRDISMLSTIRDEEEILLLPGAKFKVDVVKRYGTGNAGNTTVPAKRWFTVEMTQTE